MLGIYARAMMVATRMDDFQHHVRVARTADEGTLPRSTDERGSPDSSRQPRERGRKCVDDQKP